MSQRASSDYYQLELFSPYHFRLYSVLFIVQRLVASASANFAHRSAVVMATDSGPGTKSWNSFDVMLAVTHFVGFVTICLNGYFFNTFKNGLAWPTKMVNLTNPDDKDVLGKRGDQLHAFLMVIAFIYLQGEALLAYRVHRYQAKIVSKLIHAALHIFAIGLGLTALAVIIMSTNYSGYNNFTSAHSWIGICFLIMYTCQFTFGFLTYFCPFSPVKYRAGLMPIHRVAGISCLLVGCVQCCLGFSNVLSEVQPPCFDDLSCVNRIEYIGAFSVISIVLYTVLVLAVLFPISWRREKTPDELK